jgi:hypothetical protein
MFYMVFQHKQNCDKMGMIVKGLEWNTFTMQMLSYSDLKFGFFWEVRMGMDSHHGAQ